MGFYSKLREIRGDDEDLQKCIENVVDQLEKINASQNPGMLLGKIQSGKTRAFLGVIARTFDKNYDVAIVLTKGTRTLASQTVKRIGRDFKEFIDNDQLILFDIMEAPIPLTKSELKRKLVIVAKKQTHNLTRIQKLFDTDHPELRERRVLLVDDEADMTSVRFSKKKGEDLYDQGTIAKQMDGLRGSIENISFLQVTATPYALYLQPEDYTGAKDAKEIFYPKKPSFTEVLPIHDAYVGGDAYFGGHGSDDPRHYLYVRVEEREHDALRSNDGRSIRDDRLWISENIKMLRRSLISFLLSVAVRRRQELNMDRLPQKYAMIMHNDTQRIAHRWQSDIVVKLLTMFERAVLEQDIRLRNIFDESYADIKRSVLANDDHMPTEDEAYNDVCELIEDGELNVQLVNSDTQLAPLLDPDTAELKLRAKANLFIGGSILDRGITVPNLLSFYYGRNPRRMQADTVLQHSRMYGARPKADLAVTRMYTSHDVYIRLAQIHDLEVALREAFLNGSHDQGVVFIQNDSTKGIIPCSPSKIMLSDVIAVKPSDILTPTGFDTVAASNLLKVVKKIEDLIPSNCYDTKHFLEIDKSRALTLIDLISKSLIDDFKPDFDWEAMKSLLEYYLNKTNGPVLLLVETGRKLSKEASGDRSGLSILGTAELRNMVKSPSQNAPVLVLLKQEGGNKLGWRSGPFWWPMLVSPPGAKACVFATKVAT